MRAYKFRLYPSKAQEKQLNFHLWQSKEPWNEMLSFSKELYKNHRRFPTKRTPREFVKHSDLYSQVGQELVDRLCDSLWKKSGPKAGFPRFKSFDRMKSLLIHSLAFPLGRSLRSLLLERFPLRSTGKLKELSKH